ncbi:MAG: hypothetical protein HOY75_08050 [Streptomyces sp.]|nr:hypothetical protein [Streptomyces sp.]
MGKWQNLNDLDKALDTALSGHMQAVSDRAMAGRIESAGAGGGKEAAMKVAAEMTPEQAARVIKHLS